MLQETTWRIDWQLRGRQRVAADVYVDEENPSIRYVYNYVVAPLRYTGNAPCNYSMYVACYKETRATMPSLDLADVTTCAWNTGVNAVVLRVLNNNEAFFAVATDADIRLWLNAVAKAPNPQPGFDEKLVLWYAGESPNDLVAIQDAAERTGKLVERLMIYLYWLPILWMVRVLLEDQRDCEAICSPCAALADCLCDC